MNPWYSDKITCICAKTSDGEYFARVQSPSEEGDTELELIKEFKEWLDSIEGKYFLLTKNGKGFDIPFIMSRLAKRQALESLAQHYLLLNAPHFDLQEVTKKRISLQTMAELLGCTPKSGTGKNAIKLYKEKHYDELMEYCMQDVETTIEVFEKWRSLQK